MFRLLKLAMYAFVGYAIYEFYQGLMQQQGRGGGMGGGSFSAGRSQGYSGAGMSDRGSAQNITGPGAGQAVETLENDGGSVRHNVGRGVIST